MGVPGTRILITRPQAQAERFARALGPLCVEPLIEPLLEVMPVRAQQPEWAHYQALVVTSENALLHDTNFSEALSLPVYCVGQQTAQAARGKGFQTVMDADGNAEDLMALLANTLSDHSRPLLYLRGVDVSAPLPDKAAALGFKMEEMITYHAKLVDSLSKECVEFLQQKRIAAVTFFSRRTALHFIYLAEKQNFIGALSHTKLLSISPAVLECVRHIDWQDTYTAEKPNQEAMLKLVKDVCVD